MLTCNIVEYSLFTLMHKYVEASVERLNNIQINVQCVNA